MSSEDAFITTLHVPDSVDVGTREIDMEDGHIVLSKKRHVIGDDHSLKMVRFNNRINNLD